MPARSPSDLVFTLFGDFLLHRPGPVWVGSLIALMEPLGVTPGHARTVLSRMASRGWLEARREGRRAYYDLTERGRRLLEEGEARIYHPERPQEWDGEWTLLAYSIPEERRPARDGLRVRLSWLGFGSLGNGLWLSPYDVRTRVDDVAEELGVREYVQYFRGRHLGYAKAPELVAQCWNLGEVNARYEAFVDRHLTPFADLKKAGTGSIAPEDAYVRRFDLVHEYREFPLVDPFLPGPLQPPDWAGECAQALFQAYHDLLEGPADRFLESVVESPVGEASPDEADVEESSVT